MKFYDKEPEVKNIVIDGEKFSDLEGFYLEIDRLLTKDLEWKTGHNLDAFNDLLRGGFGVHEYGEVLQIKWINFAKSRQDFGYDATIEYYQGVIKRCHPTNIEYVQQELLNAKERKGKTILDIIIEIILDSDNTGHYCELAIEE